MSLIFMFFFCWYIIRQYRESEMSTGRRENHREDVAGRANVEDTPELLAYYDELENLDAGALWTVANKIEPWQPRWIFLRLACRLSPAICHRPAKYWAMRRYIFYRETPSR